MVARRALAALALIGAPAGAQTVALRLLPRTGDTLHVRFEQSVEGPAGQSAMQVLSRSIVERGDASGSVVVAITDSVRLQIAGAPPELVERERRRMQGKQTRLRVAPDGAMTWLRGADEVPPTDGSGAAMALPGTLPAMPVRVGATWTRAMPLPLPDGAPGAAPRLDVTIRLDSLSRGGAVAHLSLRGALAPEGAAPRARGLALVAGTATGTLALDLARGWVAESHVVYVLDVVPAGAPPGAARPTRLVVKQHVRAR